ncbi:MAG: PDC sensor domain-containing protein, partial [Bacteroidota bacterium]
MKIKLKIQQKIQLFIITSSIVIYLVAVGYISYNARTMAYNDAIKLTDSQVEKSANNIKAQFDAQLSAVMAISNVFKVYKDFEKDEWQDLIHKIYQHLIKNNPDIYAVWDSWELSAIDTTWDKPYGRISHSLWRENGIIKENVELRSLDGDSELYAETKSKLTPHINEPYFDVLTEGKKEALLMTSLNAPLVENGQYIGVVSYDITLEQIQEIIEKIKPYPGSYAFIISTKGAIAGHPNEELLNKNIKDVFPELEKKEDLSEKIADGKYFSYTTKNENGSERYVSYAPIQIKNTDAPWSIAISVPVNTIMAQANKNFRISIFVGLIGILLISLVIFIISKNITNPITRITALLKKLAVGHLDDKMRINLDTGDEIEEMGNALNQSIDGLNKKADFAQHIGSGDLQYDFEQLSDDDILGKSLLDMRNSLVKAKEDEKNRKKEDEKRRWANEGLANFADILRQNNDDIEELATEIIMSLVNYLNANQGGLFILNDNDKEN